MKVYPEKLATTFTPALSPLYIISSDETLLINEAADSIRAAARQQGFMEREVFHTDSNNFDWESVLQSLNSMSLFSEKKLLEIRCSKKTLNDEKFLRYWQRPNPDVTVLVLVEKLDKTTQNTKWFGTLEKAGVFVQIWPLDDEQLNRWLTQRAKQQELKVDHQGIRILQERTEGNLLAAAQELEKLHLLFGDETITAEKLADAVSDNARYDVFKLVDAALAGESTQVLRILNGLHEEGTALTFILWAVTRELRTLATISEAWEKNSRNDQVFIRNGVWEKRQPLFQAALKRLQTSRILQLLQQASQIDLASKGMNSQNPRDGLEKLCLSLAGTTLAC